MNHATTLAALHAALAEIHNPMQHVDVLNRLVAELRLVDHEQAWALNHQAEGLARMAGDDSKPYTQGLIDCFYWRSKLLFSEQSYHQALTYLFRASKLCQLTPPRQPNPHWLDILDTSFQSASLGSEDSDAFLASGIHSAAVHNALGVLLIVLGNYTEALQYLQRAKRDAIQLNDQWFEALICNNLGFLHCELQSPEIALNDLAHGLRLLEAMTQFPAHLRMRAEILDNSGRAACALKQFEQAVSYGEQALALYHEIDWQHGQAECHNNLGLAYAGLDQQNQAIEHFTQAYELACGSNNIHEAIEALIRHGVLLNRIKHYQAARVILEQALISVNPAINQQKIYRAHQALADTYEALGDFKASLKHYKAYYELKDTVFNEQSVRRMQVLQTMYRLDEARNQAALYHLQNDDLHQQLADIQQINLQLAEWAKTDSLTEILNRRGLYEQIDLALQHQQTDAQGWAWIMFDIDFFKAINDSYGHDSGDEVLRGIAQRARLVLRHSDVFGRYGGEEFLVFLPHTSMQEAIVIAERLRTAIANTPYVVKQTAVNVTISLGIAWTEQVDDPERLTQLADQALYRSKAAGRNCYTVERLDASVSQLSA